MEWQRLLHQLQRCAPNDPSRKPLPAANGSHRKPTAATASQEPPAARGGQTTWVGKKEDRTTVRVTGQQSRPMGQQSTPIVVRSLYLSSHRSTNQCDVRVVSAKTRRQPAA